MSSIATAISIVDDTPGGRGVRTVACRLRIRSGTRATPPEFNERGTLGIVFDGALANRRELSSDLQGKGCQLRTGTDAEIVLRLYEELGPDCVVRLRGAFAFCVLGGDRLFLARDGIGIRPLYYAAIPESRFLAIASTVKGILEFSEIDPRLDMQAFADSLLVGHPLGTDTYFEDISVLAAGHTLHVDCNGTICVGRQQRFQNQKHVRAESMSRRAAEDALAWALEDAVAANLSRSMTVGVNLSGGLDSTMLAMLVRDRAEGRIATFTVADHPEHPDMLQAGAVAAAIGSHHHAVVVGFDDFLAAIPGYVAAMEDYSSLSCVPLYLLYRSIGASVDVCLQGEGADEAFGAYIEFISLSDRVAQFRDRMPLVRRLGIVPSDRAVELLTQFSRDCRTFDGYLANVARLSDRFQWWHLFPLDKCARAANVEVRVPYLDDRVLALLERLPSRLLARIDLGVSKYILRTLFLARFGLDLVDVVLRDKLGIPSSGSRLRMRFDTLCDQKLPENHLARHELGFCFQSKWQLLNFELFCEIFLKYRGDSTKVEAFPDYLNARQ